MNKSLKTILSMVIVSATVLSGCAAKPSTNSGTNTSNKAFKVGMVTDLGSVNDKSFNQSAWEGLQRLQKDNGYSVKYLEPKSDAEVMPNLLQFVNSGYDLTWATAATLSDAVTQISKSNPNAKLGIVDSELVLPNVASVSFKEQEGSFLVGVIAGLKTKTNKVGFIGGMEIPVIKKFEAGFKAGVKAVNPDAKVIVNYTGVFNRVDMGKSAAATIYNDGADIIFHAAGLTGNGVFNEAQERFNNGKKVWVIGVDKDQSLTFGSDVTLTSMMKNVDNAVYQISKSAADGKFPGGKVTYLGLKEDGVGIAPTSNKNVDADTLKKVEEYKQKIIKGEIQVPVQ